MAVWNEIINSLGSVGFFDYVLPFLLVFALTYGLLESIDIIDNERANALIGLVFSFFFISMTGFSQVSSFLQSSMALYGIFLIIVLLLAMPMAFGGQSITDMGLSKIVAGVAVLGGAIVLFGFQFSVGGSSTRGGTFILDKIFGSGIGDVAGVGVGGDTLIVIAVLAITLGLVYWTSLGGE